MTRTKPESKIIGIKPVFDSILVCNSKQLRPFVEILVQESENIDGQNLGTLIGIFEVTDTSEDSSYIVNYLISVIKKEYFSKSKRGPIESLESALHKANLALSKLAEHENIGWLGKLNAVVAVTEKNNLHLSQTGTVSAFLLRSKIMTDVSEGLAPSAANPYPLKTFVSVSSGRLEKDDKLIIATASIFDIFSLEEIKKSSLRFSNKEFVQFMRTALSNEMEMAAVLIVELQNQKEIIQEPVKKSSKEINAFSRDSFSKSTAPRKNKEEKIEQEIQREIQATPADFIDEKTGHIYIKEDHQTIAPEADSVNYSTVIAKTLIAQLKNIRLPRLAIPKPNIEKIRINSGQIAKKAGGRMKIHAKTAAAFARITAVKTASFAKITATKTSALTAKTLSAENKDATASFCKNIYRKLLSALRFILPDFEKIKGIGHRMNYQQRIYALLLLILIVVVPLVAIKIKNANDAKNALLLAEQNKPLVVIVPLEQDKNVVRLDAPASIYSGNSILKTLNLNNKIFAITAAEIVDLEKNQSFLLPADFGSPLQIAGMSDLNLIFLVNKDNKIISFSPISSAFKDNAIEIPADSTVRAIGTYLTYAYLLDTKNNQIYRYPRAEGGFGAATNWIKDPVNLSETIDMAINENVFLASNNSVLKLFRGKTQDFAMESTATPISISKIALGEQSGTVFIFDQQNSRIIHLDADGKIIAQYYHPEISSANSLAVSEENKMIYFSDKNNIKTIAIN